MIAPPSSRRARRLLVGGLLGALVAAPIPLAVGAERTPVVPWTGGGPATVAIGNDGTAAPAQMSYSLRSKAVYSRQTWSFSTTARHDDPTTVKYDYRGFHAFYKVIVFLNAFVTHNGVTTTTSLVSAGPVNCCTSPSSGFDYKGSVTLNVQTGDTYGFQFGGSNYDSNDILSGTLIADTIATSEDQCKDGGWKAVTT
ncbi:MAG: hypothetical protein ACREQ5_18510, partial [Candidatus Dormibacteria bacterium]